MKRIALALLLALSTFAQAQTTVSVTAAGNPATAASAITGAVLPTNGGTGVANADTKTITLGGPLVTSGAYTTTLTSTATTNATLPAGTHSLAPLDSPSFTTPTLGAANATSINFGGTALSSYVEGTCTITMFNASNGSGAFTAQATQTCRYVKIGKQVTMTWKTTVTHGAGVNGTVVGIRHDVSLPYPLDATSGVSGHMYCSGSTGVATCAVPRGTFDYDGGATYLYTVAQAGGTSGTSTWFGSLIWLTP